MCCKLSVVMMHFYDLHKDMFSEVCKVENLYI